MALAKSITKTLDIDVEDVRIDLMATIKSYDLTDTKFIFDIQSSKGLTIDLTGSTAMYVVEYVHNSQTYAIEGDMTVVNSTKISFNLPEDLKGYKGTILIGLYVRLTDGTKIDIKEIAVRVEPSIMDKGLYFTAKAYFKDFEAVKAEVILEGEKAKTDIKAIVADVQQTGETAKAEIKATLPTLQGQVSELKEDLVNTETSIQRKDIVFSELDEYKATIQSNGVWSTASGVSSKVLKYEYAQRKICVRANENKGAIVSFLRTIPKPLEEKQADFCIGETSRHLVEKGKHQILDIPFDCSYIVFTDIGSTEPSNLPKVCYLFDNSAKHVENNIKNFVNDFLGYDYGFVKYRTEFFSSEYDGCFIHVSNSIGKPVENISIYSTDSSEGIRIYKVDVSEYEKISIPVIKSTSGLGNVFVDDNDVIISGYVNSALDSGSQVVLNVPTNAKYLLMTTNKNWTTNWHIAGAKKASKYPSLTNEQKQKITELCEKYYQKRNEFVYGGWYRNQYSSKSTALDRNGKFYLNCGNFTQMIWMGRSASDFIADSYTNIINTEFDFGYYFDFAYHKKAYGVYKNPQGSTDSEKYYTFQKPNESNGYSYNTYYAEYSRQQEWRWYMAAADLAYELYNMGCEVPRDELEVGDMIFYRDADYDGMTTETQLNFRNISHVAIVVDTNYDGKGHMRCVECTPRTTPTIAYCSIAENDMQNALRSVFYEQRIVMVARHPSAFGKGGNVPDRITAI